MSRCKNVFFFLSSIFMLHSCDYVDMLQAEKPECIEVRNIYKELDMSMFKGFVDLMPLQELFEKNGIPDTIIDAEDVAMVEGYNIYEYKYPKGDIDCYVKKGIATKDALVDYIYYEPKDNIKLVDFIIKDSLRTLIQNKKSEVFYIVDGICNSPVRIRLFRKKRDEISNIALNDMSILKEKKDVSAYIQKNIKSYIPIQMGDLGLLSKIEFNNNELQLFLTVDESSSKRVLDIVKNNPKI